MIQIHWTDSSSSPLRSWKAPCSQAQNAVNHARSRLRALEGSSRLPRHPPGTRSETPRSKYYRNRTEQLYRRRIHMHNDFNCKQETLKILVRFLHTMSIRFGVLGCFLRRVPPRVVWRKTWWNEGNDKCRETRACDGLHWFTFGAHMMPRHPASHVSESGRLVAVC